jgi:hypothetical protein
MRKTDGRIADGSNGIWLRLFRLSTNAGWRRIGCSAVLIFCRSGTAAACASLLPRYRKTEVGDQKSQLVLALASVALRQRLGL